MLGFGWRGEAGFDGRDESSEFSSFQPIKKLTVLCAEIGIRQKIPVREHPVKSWQSYPAEEISFSLSVWPGTVAMTDPWDGESNFIWSLTSDSVALIG